jgi:type II secretory pathway pseudopilin PulG
VTLAVFGLVAALVVPSLGGLVPAWRLRAAACEVESAVQWAVNAAATTGRGARVCYDVPEGVFWVGVGDQALAARRLPAGVRFERVEFADGLRVERDVAAAPVFPDGALAGHAVLLAAADGRRLRLEFARLTAEAFVEERKDDAGL